MHLLDTDTLTYFYAGQHRVVERFHSIADAAVGTTIITKIELLRGRFDFVLKADSGQNLLRAQQLLMRTEELLGQIIIVPFDNAAALQFEALRAKRELGKIGRADLLIASIALAHRATLVTRNLRHFRQIPSLSVENWVD